MPPAPAPTPIPDPAAFDAALLASRLKALNALDHILESATDPRDLQAAAVAILRLKPAAETPPIPLPTRAPAAPAGSAPAPPPTTPPPRQPSPAPVPAAAPPAHSAKDPVSPAILIPLTPPSRPAAHTLRAAAGIAPAFSAPPAPA